MSTKIITYIIMTGLLLNVFVLYWLVFSLNGQVQKQTLRQSAVLSPTGEIVEDDGQAVERNVTFVGPTTDCNDCLERLASLENEIQLLKTSISTSGPSSGSTAYVGAKEIYVPFGSGNGQSRDWEDVPGMAAYIDTSGYSAIDYVQFEGSLRIPSGVGRAYARLYNKTDNNYVYPSEVSADTEKSILFESDGITLATGNKLYQVQLKSTVGAVALVETARVKIVLK